MRANPIVTHPTLVYNADSWQGVFRARIIPVAAEGGLGDQRLSRLVISEEHISSINASLDRLVEAGDTYYALLLDRSGQLVACRGEFQERETEGLGALLAGNYASARAIARLIGEDSFGAVFQQGQQRHIFTALVNEHWLLSVVFGARTPLGLVKVLCGRVATDLNKVHESVCEASLGVMGHWRADQAFRILAQHTIDTLLREGN